MNSRIHFDSLKKSFKRIKNTLVTIQNVTNKLAKRMLKKYYVGKCFKREYSNGSVRFFKIVDLEADVLTDTLLTFGPTVYFNTHGEPTLHDNSTTAIIFGYDFPKEYSTEIEITEQEFNKIYSKTEKI